MVEHLSIRLVSALASMGDMPENSGSNNIDFEAWYEQLDSEHQVTWTETMGKGNYKRSSCHSKVSVLTLNWAKEDDDLNVQSEVDQLANVFKDKFNYSVTQFQLTYAPGAPAVQHQLNASITKFICDNDGPNHLLIVYYAGHAEPGEDHGSIVMYGLVCSLSNPACAINSNSNGSNLAESDNSLSRFVWNRTETCLLDAAADIFLIFDW